ncbi:Gfo/Idh/MocA family oxidoreductase [Lentisphaera profundi]|uniref:Gfo/Idh/MocA family oxidoreductase n=1 Tax=Lentisphaera profundi TaxID=1658616 RepID=A0ABY7VMS0_9BACT|nr:Gfo/Idh/MocA family oxidoreductase [Lentisphaera profundi]WDE95330.1 Gfo/Idh/MocA family oxidoreductase [Lentisphaera profundi]
MDIRIGIIGAGENTRLKHIPLLQKIEGVQIVAISNRSMASAQKVCDQFNIANAYDDWQKIIHDPTIDAVLIGTWPNMHKLLTCEALKAGKHVLCEARMARDLAEAREMLDESHLRPSQIAQIVPAPFTLKYDTEIIKLIGNNFFGDILAVNGRFNFNTFLDADAPMHWRENRDISGNNIMLMGILYESMSRWLGPAKSVIASGKIFSSLKDYNGKARPVDIPEHLNILAQVDNGVEAHLQFSSVTALEDCPQSIWIFGSNGTAHLDLKNDQLLLGKKGDTELQLHNFTPPADAIWRVEEEFINAIRGTEKINLTDFDTAFQYMKFTEAVTLSLQEDKRIHLSNLGTLL